jgi:hypothetical protein
MEGCMQFELKEKDLVHALSMERYDLDNTNHLLLSLPCK